VIVGVDLCAIHSGNDGCTCSLMEILSDAMSVDFVPC